jgi:psiF repeat-containing protein
LLISPARAGPARVDLTEKTGLSCLAHITAEGETMPKYFAAALAIAFLAASSAAPSMAQSPEKAEKREKKISAQQQKMKDCAAKWKEEKATKSVKGREAYRKFMSGCLKG